jgi:hypothetical protein
MSIVLRTGKQQVLILAALSFGERSRSIEQKKGFAVCQQQGQKF